MTDESTVRVRARASISLGSITLGPVCRCCEGHTTNPPAGGGDGPNAAVYPPVRCVVCGEWCVCDGCQEDWRRDLVSGVSHGE